MAGAPVAAPLQRGPRPLSRAELLCQTPLDRSDLPEGRVTLRRVSEPLSPLPFATRFWFAWSCFVRLRLDGSFAARVFAVREPTELPAGKPTELPAGKPAEPALSPALEAAPAPPAKAAPAPPAKAAPAPPAKAAP